jgi:hypothetical protein
LTGFPIEVLLKISCPKEKLSMSIEKNKQESKRWLRTAEDDLDTSILLVHGMH